jgi:hypothetical protein
MQEEEIKLYDIWVGAKNQSLQVWRETIEKVKELKNKVGEDYRAQENFYDKQPQQRRKGPYMNKKLFSYLDKNLDLMSIDLEKKKSMYIHEEYTSQLKLKNQVKPKHANRKARRIMQPIYIMKKLQEEGTVESQEKIDSPHSFHLLLWSTKDSLYHEKEESVWATLFARLQQYTDNGIITCSKIFTPSLNLFFYECKSKKSLCELKKDMYIPLKIGSKDFTVIGASRNCFAIQM